MAALVAITTGTFAAQAVTELPLPEADPLLQTTFLCAADVAAGCDEGSSLAQLRGDEVRSSVTFEQLPKVLIEAILAAEDRDFFRHKGVDPVGVARALWQDIRAGSTSQGGSTITQQYVKNVFLTNERTVDRKVREAVLAVKLEREFDKKEILTRYLNTIYFGRGAYGVQAASRAYFGKDVEEVGLAEAAYLAALIRSPESADAWRSDDRDDPVAERELATATRRRRSVLDAMADEGWISETARDAADAVAFDEPYLLPRSQGSTFGVVKGREVGSEYFVEHVRQWLRTTGGFSDSQIFGGGLRVYTTLDLDVQADAWNAVHTVLSAPEDPAAALVAIDRQGQVRAMVGGTDFAASQVNLATGADGGGSGRQPGSAFKALVLAEAVRQDVSVLSVFDAPSSIVIPKANGGSDWKVSNYGGDELGRLTLVEATMKSSNTVYAQLMMKVGPEAVVALAEQMGVTAELQPYPALGLGAAEVSVLDMASAFSTFMDDGEHVDPVVVTRVEDAAGNVVYQANPTRTRVLSAQQAATVNWVLRQVVEKGTGTGAAYWLTSAGKTGTTQDNRDAWFVGYTCELTAAVWMGYPGAPGEPVRFMNSVHGRPVTGGGLPATIWRAFMLEATEGANQCDYERPSEIPGDFLASTTTSTASTTTTGSTTTTTATTGSTTTTAPLSTTTTSPPTTVGPTTTSAPPPPPPLPPPPLPGP